MNHRHKIIFFTICFFLFSFVIIDNVFAENIETQNHILTNSEVKTYSDLNVDIALAETKYDQYGPVSEISLCNITKTSGYSLISSEQWIADLYYYMITESHFFDIPFNYIVDGTNIYQTRVNSPIDLQPLTENQQNRIVIGIIDLYTQKNYETKSFLEEIAGFYDISANNVKISECLINKVDTSNNFVSYLNIKPTAKTIFDIYESFSPYKTNSKKFNAQLISTEYDKEVEPYQKLKIILTLKNTGNSPWYNNSGITLVTNNELMKNSDFYISNDWMSRSHVAQIEEIVPVGEEYRLTFYLQPHPIPGTSTEDFILIDPYGIPITGTEVNLSFTTKDLGYIFVKVKPNAYGFLNVREQPARDAEIITKVEPSNLFLQLEEKNGWIKLKIDDQREGWVVSSYVEKLQ